MQAHRINQVRTGWAVGPVVGVLGFWNQCRPAESTRCEWGPRCAPPAARAWPRQAPGDLWPPQLAQRGRRRRVNRTLLPWPARRPQGLRNDYVLCTPGLLPLVVSCEILSAADIPPKWSDHAALLLELRDVPTTPPHAPCAAWTKLLRRFKDPAQRSILSMFGKRQPAGDAAQEQPGASGAAAAGAKRLCRPDPAPAPEADGEPAEQLASNPGDPTEVAAAEQLAPSGGTGRRAAAAAVAPRPAAKKGTLASYFGKKPP